MSRQVPGDEPHVSPHGVRRWLARAAVVYLLLLASSHLVRWSRGPVSPPPMPSEMRVLETTEVARSGLDAAGPETRPIGRTVRLAWRQWPPPADAVGSTPWILLIHGSPGDSGNFDRLGPLLAERGFRVVAPDLPGFGASSSRVADYSIVAHAAYCRALLEALGARDVHAVGFSMGGGVALHLDDSDPERIASVTMLSSIGVQEMELLGSYTINHAVHGAQLAGLTFLFEGVPHFGVLDPPILGIPYARNFYDTDQRPLRGLLQSFDDPMLILHGEKDFLVPFAAAQEHHRLVPQSRLVTFQSLGASPSHFAVFESPRTLADAIASFARDVESGDAPRRADAAPERLAAATSGQPFQLPRAAGPTLVVWVLLLALATFVSEDLTCIAAGLLVAQGGLGFVPAVVGCAAGIFVGDLGLYGFGRLGRPWLERIPLRWIVRPRSVRRAELWFGRRGPVVIFLSRFLPGTRIATYVAAGLLGMGLVRFAVSLFVPVMLWVPLVVWVAGQVGGSLFAGLESLESHSLPLFFGALVAVWCLVALLRGLVTWRGRRMLHGRWLRWTRWEFWPPWLAYPPVVAYIAWLAVRHRSATLFTAANPGLDAGGGFVGESKSRILGDLDHCLQGTRAEGSIATFEVLPSGPPAHRLQSVLAFQRHHGWPVVIKPDVGQRGDGVVVARTEAEVENFLHQTPGVAVVQRYVGGVELGIFWLHVPGEAGGRIFSITDKRLPEVVGDGRRTLERLILEDPRAIAMAPTYLDLHFERLDTVPAEGERVRLVELGTHCRGAVFLDGGHLATPQLAAAMNAIGEPFEGFAFGRFDVRAPSHDHFRRGEELHVLEVNGVTSEATHIYDPAVSLRDAYGTLFEQWRLAFEIGRRQRDRGHRPTGFLALARMALRFLAGR